MRWDRLYPLDLMCGAPSSDTLDMVFFYPNNAPASLHLFLYTQARSVELYLDEEKIPEAGPAGTGWIAFQQIDRLGFRFGMLRIRGMKMAEARKSWLLVTIREDYIPSGSVENVQRQLFGLSSAEAGRSEITPCVIRTGDPACFTATYIAPEEGLPAEAFLRCQIPYAFSLPQWEDEKKEGFCSVKADRAVRVLPVQAPGGEESHEKVFLRFQLPEGLRAGERLEVTYSTLHTHMYHHAEGQEPMLTWYANVPTMQFEVAVDDREQYVQMLPSNTHRVTYEAGEAEKLLLTLPAVRRSGSGLILRGRFTDRLRNYPPKGMPDTDFRLMLEPKDGEPAELDNIRWEGLYAFSVALPDLQEGVYRVRARAEDGRTVARSNPLLIKADAKKELFFGEIHCHSEMSDGSNTYEHIYRFARDAALLDFASGLDHACYFTDNEWAKMEDITNSFHQPGVFATLVGYEWAGRQVHRNVYTSRDRLRLFRGMHESTSNLNVLNDAFRGDEQVVLGCHAPMAHGIEWSQFDPEVERYIEIYSMWGRSDLRGEEELMPYRPSSQGSTVNELMLSSDARLSFTAGGDCHEANCGMTCRDDEAQGGRPHNFSRNIRYSAGLTAAWLENLDREALIDALRERHTYATTGVRTIAFFGMDEVDMGGESRGKGLLHAEIHAEGELEMVRIIRNGVVWQTLPLEGLDASFAIETEEPGAKADYYYLEIVQKDGNRVWVTPVWRARG